MENGTLKIQVKDSETQQVLFECPLSEQGRAFEFAGQMEELGVSVVLVHPTLSQTLSNSLGLTRDEQALFEQSMDEEMESHEGSCCFNDPVNPTRS